LTEQQVIDWVKATTFSDQIARVEQMLNHRIELMKNPPVVAMPKAAPWNTCSQG